MRKKKLRRSLCVHNFAGAERLLADARDEVGHGGERARRLVAMRVMAALGQEQRLAARRCRIRRRRLESADKESV
jgi:hypothetical protein